MSMTGGIWKEKLIRIENHFSNHRTLVKSINECFFLAISSVYENNDFNSFEISCNLSPVREKYAYKLTEQVSKTFVF